MKKNKEVLKKLDVGLTEELVARLVGYCHMKAARRPWYGTLLEGNVTMAEGHEPLDIVQRVIEKTIEGATCGPGKGRRIWDGRRELYDYLTSQIDSELSNLGISWVNRNFRVASRLEKVTDEGHREAFYESLVDREANDPQDLVLNAEAERAADEFVSGFLDSLEGDPLLTTIVGEILDGAQKPREIAQSLGVEAEDVYKARKRLQRRFDNYRASRVENEEVTDG